MLLASLCNDPISCLTAVWLTVLGGVIGSFLNVVIYRLPEGISLVEPPSHCPVCKKRIRWYHNVPVFGWIVLRGRCRDCRAPIPVRYPLVEAVTAAIFGLLGVAELLSGGANFPVRPVEIPGGVLLTGISSTAVYGIYAYHLLLLCTLLCALLIEYDGKRLPRRLFVPAGLVGLLAPLVWPHLHPVAAGAGLSGAAAGLADSAAGLAVGLLLGAAVWRMSSRRQPGLVLSTGCVGLFLGWQAVAVLVLVAAALHVPAMLLGRAKGVRPIPLTAWLLLATFAWIVFWAPLVSWIGSLYGTVGQASCLPR